MSKLCNLKNLADQLKTSLPKHLKTLQKDLTKNCNFLMQRTLGKLKLVTREEFAIQSKVLSRTRKKISDLEELVNKLCNKEK